LRVSGGRREHVVDAAGVCDGAADEPTVVQRYAHRADLVGRDVQLPRRRRVVTGHDLPRPIDKGVTETR
jgi:hypothetical protein